MQSIGLDRTPWKLKVVNYRCVHILLLKRKQHGIGSEIKCSLKKKRKKEEENSDSVMDLSLLQLTRDDAYWSLLGTGCHAGSCHGGHGSEDADCDKRCRWRQPGVPDRGHDAHQRSHRPAWTHWRMCADWQKWSTVCLLLLPCQKWSAVSVCPLWHSSCQLARIILFVHYGIHLASWWE